MYDTILLPVDGSACALRAAEEARGIAERYDARVHLLSAVDVRAYDMPGPEGGAAPVGMEETLVEQGETALEDASAILEGVSHETELRHGVPANAIVEYAADEAIDLIVVGTHGRTGIDRAMLGSVAERVLRDADVPVLTVREDADAGSDERILLPTDGSDHAEAAAEHAIDLAETYGAELHVLSVLDLEDAGGLFSAGGLSEEFVEKHEEAASEATDRMADRARDAGLEVETAVVEGTPQDEILEYAEDARIDLIAMGTHGRSGVERVLLGSVTESVVREAACPVLSVRDGD